MMWDYWLAMYIQTHCAARGLSSRTMAAYQADLGHFRAWVEVRLGERDPDEVTSAEVMAYVTYLRRERCNGDSRVNRVVTVLRCFFKAIVAMGHLEPSANPMLPFPRLRARPVKLPVTLSGEEMEKLLGSPDRDTVLGLRDRAIILLLYGTGIRATECATLFDGDVDLDEQTIRVMGKGDHVRVVPLNDDVTKMLDAYRRQRGVRDPDRPFFESRSRKGMSRGAVYERVRTHARRAGIRKRTSPHVLRHTFATHLVRAGVGLVTIRDLLGHRCISSTQVYLHVTACELRDAADAHPIRAMSDFLESLLPDVALPLQRGPARRRAS
ncbi:MAG: tyrosine-type recombinase/integrase [Planctomycetes bacterium]|nr:tyrosine-type recombinase/integrase [Planctomycetota bacterium]